MIFNYDKRTGASWGGIPVIAKNIKDGFINYFSKKSFGNDILDSAFGNVKSDTKIVDIISNMSDSSQKAALTNAMGSWWSNMSQQQTQAATVADAISNIGTQSFSAASALSKLGQIGSTVLSTLGTMAITTAILSGITLLIKGLYDLATAEERAIEKGKEARQTIADINKGYNDQKDYVDKNTERYNELRKGVDVSEKSGIENVSLSTEEFNEFLSINNELARLFPSIVSGYDAQGNAMLTLSSDADTATSSLQSLLEQERQLADFKVGEQLNDAVIGFATRYKQLQEDIKEQEQTIEASQQLQTAIQEKTGDGVDLSKLGISIDGKNISYKFDQFDETQRAVADKIRQAYNEAAQGIGTVEWSGDYAITGELLGSLTYVSEDQLDEFEESFRARLSEMNLADIPEEIIDAMSVKNQDIQEIKADWNGLVPSILSQLNLYENYQKLGDLKFGEQLQNAIANDISNIDFDNFEKIYGEGAWKEFGDNARGFVREHFLDPITNALMGEDGNFDKTKTDALNKLISFDGSKLTNEEYKDQVNTIVSSITDDAEVQKDIKVILGFQYYDEEGKNHWNVTKQRDELYEALGGFVGQADEKGNKEHHIKVGMNIRWDDFKSLSQEDLNAIQYAQANMSVDLSTIDTWEQLTEAIEKAKKSMSETPEIEKDGTLSSIFSDENYQSAAEGYEKRLSSLTGALETLRSEGSLTAEAMRDLQEEFPDMTDFSEEAIGDTSFDELNKWVSLIRENMDGLSPEEIENAEAYIDNLINSFGNLGLTSSQVKDKIEDVVKSISGTSGPGLGDSIRYRTNELIDAFGKEIDENPEIVASFIADPSNLEGSVEDIIARYQDYVVEWKLEIDTSNAERDFQNAIEKLNADISKQEAINTKKEAKGELLNPFDYSGIVQDKQATADIQSDRAEYYFNRYNNLPANTSKRGRDRAWTDYLNAEADAQNAEADAFNSYKEQQESILNEANKKITNAQAEQSQAQQKIDAAIAQGIYADQSVYEDLANAQSAEAFAQRELANLLIGLSQNEKLSAFSSDYLKQSEDALSAATGLDTSAQESRLAPIQNVITNLQNQYVDLQTEATKVEEQLNSADAKRQKTSEKLYRDLIANGDDQIANMRKQIAQQKELMKGMTKTEDIRAAQSEIDSLRSSISSMQQNQLSWFDTMTSLVSTNASELSSVLSSAFSEINSETGLTIDTMNELERQFSDLSDHDVSSIFYQSADGMKMNVDAAESLVDAEYQLQQANLQEIISTNEKIAADQNATASAREQAEARIDAAQRELSMLQALYDQQKEQFSSLAKFQQAQSSANGGANFETMQGYLDTQKENRTKGLTGTDEFKAYTEYFDRWGLTTVEAWDRNKDKIERYLTEDVQGVINFMDDLVEKGFGTKEGGNYNLDLPSVEEAAAAMGMSTEWVRDMFGRAEDYGLQNDWVESELDGHLKIKEAIQDQIREQLKYNQMLKEGASQTELEEQAQEVQYATDRINNINEELDNFVDHSGQISKSQIQSAINGIASIKEQYEAAKEAGLSDDDLQGYLDSAQQLADDNYIKFKGEVSDFEIDTEQLNKDFPELEAEVHPVLPNGGEVLHQVQAMTKDEISAIQEQFKGYTEEDFNSIIFGDGEYQNEPLEKALDGILDKFELGQEYGEGLVEVLKQMFGLGSEVDTDEYMDVPTPKKEKIKQAAVVGVDETKAEQRDLRPQAESLLETAKQMAQDKINQEQYANEQKPTVDAVNQVSTALENNSSQIISAIQDLPSGIAAAIKGEPSPEGLSDKMKDAATDSKIIPISEGTLSRLNEVKTNMLPTYDLDKETVIPIDTNAIIDKKAIMLDSSDKQIENKNITIPLDEQSISIGSNFGKDYGKTLGGMIVDTAKSIFDGVIDTISSPTMQREDYTGLKTDTAKVVPKQIITDDTPILKANAFAGLNNLMPDLSSIPIIDFVDTGEVVADKSGFSDMLNEQIQHIADGAMESGEPIQIQIPLSNVLVSFVDDSGITSDAYGFESMMNDQFSHVSDGVVPPTAPIKTVSPQQQQTAEPQQSSIQVTYENNQVDMSQIVSEDVASGQATADENPISPTYNNDDGDGGFLETIVDTISQASFVAEENPIEIKPTVAEVDTSALSGGQQIVETVDVETNQPDDVEVEAKLDDTQFNATASSVESKAATLDGLNPVPTVALNDQASNPLSQIISELNSIPTTKTITINTIRIGEGSGGLGGINNGGIALADGNTHMGVALAGGTTNKDDFPMTYAGGTLVGEEAPEMHVSRDGGYWELVGQNGPEFRDDIAPGDIVFNAEQTKKLLRNGHTNTRGKALAGGTQKLTGLAFRGGLTGQNSTKSQLQLNHTGDQVKAAAGYTKATKDATAATQANTGAKNDEKEETEKTKSALEKLKDWISEFVDWVDNRIDSLTTKIDRLGKAAENATGYLNKNAKLNQAQKTLADNRTYQNALNGKMLQTNARGEAVKATGGTKKTLLFDTARGAVKYQKQADKILNKARKDGLINKKQLNMIKRQVANGSINIKKYNENVRGVIESYEEWFKKSQDLVSSMDDLVAQYKELQQTKLDNIVEEFESLANYADSVGKTSAALLSLNNTVGTVSYSKQNKNLYQDQINANRTMSSYYRQEMNAYKAEMANAAGIFGTNSNEYREAQAKFQEMNQALYEAQENAAKLTIELRKLDLKPIEYAMGRFEELGKKLAGIVSLKEARGILSGREEATRINEDDYYKQIENNNDTIVELIEKVKIQQGWLDQGFYDQNGETIVLKPESDAYRELESQIAADNEQINQLLISNENLKKSIVTLRWEAFEDLQKKLNNATSDYEHLQGLINQEGLFDDNGKGWNLTDEGVANLTLIAAKMYTAEEQIKSYREALNRVQEEYDNGNRSLQDYEETSRNHVETIQKLVDGNQNLKKSIIDTYKTQITNENNALVDLINKRKEAYDAKKA